MAGLLDPNGPADPGALYGGLLSPQQSQALGYRGLLAAAGALGQAAMPSRMPTPIGAALGSAAGAMGSAQDQGALNAMRGGLLGLQGQELRARLGLFNNLSNLSQRLNQPVVGGQMAPQAPAGPMGAPSSPATAPSPRDPRGMAPIIAQSAAKYGVDPNVALAVANSEGLRGGLGDGGTSGGAFQLHITPGGKGDAVGDQFVRDTGLNPLDPRNEPATIDYAMRYAAQNGWGAWAGAKKAGIAPFEGINQSAQASQASPPPAGMPNADIAQQMTTGMAALGINAPAWLQQAAALPLVAPTAFAKAQGNIKPFIGGERRGSPIFRYNPQTNGYELVNQNPQLPETAIENPDNSISLAKGGPEAIATVEASQAAGKAPYEPPVTLFGPGGVPYSAPRGTPPSAAAGSPGALPNQPSGALPAIQPPAAGSQPIAATTNTAAAAPGAPGSVESVAPHFPVQTAAGAKDISQVNIGDMFPDGQGVSRPPAPPAGLGYGEPTETQKEMQKDSADMVETFQKEAQGNQKIYLDLAHLRGILQAGYRTGTTAQLAGDIGNLAQSLGVTLPEGFDPTNPAVFNKAATDLVFAAVKKLAGQVRVAEITGYQKANPALAMPPQANMSIINDVLANGKWEDSRARLAGQFAATYPGAPISDFISRYNDMAPLTDVRSTYQKQILASGGTIPGFAGSGGGSGNAAAPLPRGTYNGKTYEKRAGQWFQVQ